MSRSDAPSFPRLTVSFQINDIMGKDTGCVRAVAVGEFITLKGPFRFVRSYGPHHAPDEVGTTRLIIGGDRTFRLGGSDAFGQRGGSDETYHWGCILWDCRAMDPEDVLAMLNYLKSTGDWTCDEAPAGFLAKWKEPGSLTMEDLLLAWVASALSEVRRLKEKADQLYHENNRLWGWAIPSCSHPNYKIRGDRGWGGKWFRDRDLAIAELRSRIGMEAAT